MRGRELDLARLAQPWALAPIFVPAKRGERGRLDVTLRVGESELRVVGPWTLDIGDQDVLVALVRLASYPERGLSLSASPTTPTGQAARQELAIDADRAEVRDADTLLVRTSLREIARTIGRDESGRTLKAITRSLQRLGTITVLVTRGRAWRTAHILGAGGDAEGRVAVGLHPALAEVVLGGNATRLDMVDYRALDSDVARRLLVRLSAWIDCGQTRHARVDTLLRSVWPDATTGSALRMRRSRLREALEELGHSCSGWRVVLEGRDAVITRLPVALEGGTPAGALPFSPEAVTTPAPAG